MIFIGIDNGLDGGIVVIDQSGEAGQSIKITNKYLMPTISGKKSKMEYNVPEMSRLLKQFSPENTFVVLEFAQSMPGQGVASSTKIGMGFGIWQGIIVTLGLPYTIVHPRTWQKHMLVDVNKKDTKQASAIISHRFFPNENFKKSERCKKDHSGWTDACLLSMYGMKMRNAITRLANNE